jgi:endonuclease YncB( thermonuclease family)
MATPSRVHKRRSLWITLLILVAIGVNFYVESQHPNAAKSSRPAPTPAQTPRPSARPGAEAEKTGGYEVYRNCTLAEARNNDGDSFMVRLPDGKQAEFRLYFVDTPESAFKSYAGGESNHERIRQQAAEMGHITPEQAVEIGKQGKHFTLDLLAGHPFTLYTRWDSPFNDNRYHAHVEVRHDTASRWLDELLIERGLARIKTKPADLPDGTPASKHLAHLKQLERAAQKAKRGVWSF